MDFIKLMMEANDPHEKVSEADLEMKADETDENPETDQQEDNTDSPVKINKQMTMEVYKSWKDSFQLVSGVTLGHDFSDRICLSFFHSGNASKFLHHADSRI